MLIHRPTVQELIHRQTVQEGIKYFHIFFQGIVCLSFLGFSIVRPNIYIYYSFGPTFSQCSQKLAIGSFNVLVSGDNVYFCLFCVFTDILVEI